MMAERSGPSPLLAGEIVFPASPLAFGKATVHLFLEDTTLADATATVVIHQVIEAIAAATIRDGTLPFTLHGALPDRQARYTVRVWVDVDGDDKVSQGDFISMVSYPVLTRGYPDHVVVLVQQLR